jgi:hypothetical protein
MQLLPLLIATAGMILWIALSPVRRRILRETFAHPSRTSVIVRDERTGKVRSYLLPDDRDRQAQSSSDR